jgi:ribonuclease HI
MKQFARNIAQFWMNLRKVFTDHKTSLVPDRGESHGVPTQDASLTERTIRAIITRHCRGEGSFIQTMIRDSEKAQWDVARIVVPQPCSPEQTSAIVLDEFARVHTLCVELDVVGDVHVSYRPVRETLMKAQPSFPATVLREKLTSSEKTRTQHKALAFELPLDVVLPLVVPKPSPVPLVVATDGSADINKNSGLGWAYVTADGRSNTGNSALGTCSTRAELRGIELVLTDLSGKLTIYTDSKIAIAWITTPSLDDKHAYTPLVKNIRKMMKTSGSELVWVKGHAGNSYNEQADRLAKQARFALKKATTDCVSVGSSPLAHERPLALAT